MCLEERYRYCKIIECIRDTVGESADDEEGHTEQKRKIILLTGECDGCSHYESAAYSEKTAAERAVSEPHLENLLCSRLQIHIRCSRQKRHKKTTDNIGKKYHQKVKNFTFVYESSRSGI